MTDTTSVTATDTLAQATALLGTLRQETHSYKALLQRFEEQRVAVTQQDPLVLEDITIAISELVHGLNQLRVQREAQLNLLHKGLGEPVGESRLVAVAQALGAYPESASLNTDLQEARIRLRQQTEVANQQCDDLLFTVGYAMQMGHERLNLMKGVAENRPSQVYTAKGGAAQNQTARSLLNQVG